MPSPDEILESLRLTSNNWRLLSLLWHGYFAFLVVPIVIGRRATKPMVGVLLTLPILSVSILAWISTNPFNGTVFAVLAIALLVIAMRLPPGNVKVAPYPVAVPGVLMIGFGWVYPHFIDNATPVEYLYAAPTGLIPCPTLAIVIGVTLLLGGLESRPWCLLLAVAGFFYSIYGAGWLGVRIDWILLLGILITAYVAFSPHLMGDRHGGLAD